eukprot:CAMPEP_0198663520 /NCGR_PEP_ID=MMETSP1467-20131203/52252_1 /TAXON_ID=1462469 /ORGANISM="unid. sp., Strain CCMP2135" /LENGTH=113 /DNA_ID=CAMNT_0044400051 /DNA_START=124 /DNA_END=462 /DNA_ORIENTATION=+
MPRASSANELISSRSPGRCTKMAARRRKATKGDDKDFQISGGKHDVPIELAAKAFVDVLDNAVLGGRPGVSLHCLHDDVAVACEALVRVLDRARVFFDGRYNEVAVAPKALVG